MKGGSNEVVGYSCGEAVKSQESRLKSGEDIAVRRTAFSSLSGHRREGEV